MRKWEAPESHLLSARDMLQDLGGQKYERLGGLLMDDLEEALSSADSQDANIQSVWRRCSADALLTLCCWA